MTEQPEHLTVITSDRGFDHLPKINTARAGYVRAYESSSAESASVWLDVNSGHAGQAATVHLTTDEAWQLADQLRFLVANHYWGDQTPDWATGEKVGSPGTQSSAFATGSLPENVDDLVAGLEVLETLDLIDMIRDADHQQLAEACKGNPWTVARVARLAEHTLSADTIDEFLHAVAVAHDSMDKI